MAGLAIVGLAKGIDQQEVIVSSRDEGFASYLP